MVHAQTKIRPGEYDKILWDFEMKDHQIHTRKPDIAWVNKKKELVSCWSSLFQQTTKQIKGKIPVTFQRYKKELEPMEQSRKIWNRDLRRIKTVCSQQEYWTVS